MRDDRPQNSSATTGLLPPSDQAQGGPAPRPLSLAWVPDGLVARTMALWSRKYGRPVSEAEAVELLLNVKRLAQALAKTCQEAEP